MTDPASEAARAIGDWRPASEYRPDMGRVLVWLAWPPSLNFNAGGHWCPAYAMIITDGAPVWVDAALCEPIETTGRRVTHFAQPRQP